MEAGFVIASFMKASFMKASFMKASFMEAGLVEANFGNVNFMKVNSRRAMLANADPVKVSLEEAWIGPAEPPVVKRLQMVGNPRTKKMNECKDCELAVYCFTESTSWIFRTKEEMNEKLEEMAKCPIRQHSDIGESSVPANRLRQHA